MAGVLMVATYFITNIFLTVTTTTFVAVSAVFCVMYGIAILRFGGIEAEDVMISKAFEERAGVDLSRIRQVLDRFVE